MVDVEDKTNTIKALSNLQFDETLFVSFNDLNQKLKNQDYNFIFKD